MLCDRDPKWSGGVEQWLATAGVRVVRKPARAPNCNTYAERFVRSVKEEAERLGDEGANIHRIVLENDLKREVR